jgi:hypothetical protein
MDGGVHTDEMHISDCVCDQTVLIACLLVPTAEVPDEGDRLVGILLDKG